MTQLEYIKANISVTEPTATKTNVRNELKAFIDSMEKAETTGDTNMAIGALQPGRNLKSCDLLRADGSVNGAFCLIVVVDRGTGFSTKLRRFVEIRASPTKPCQAQGNWRYTLATECN